MREIDLAQIAVLPDVESGAVLVKLEKDSFLIEAQGKSSNGDHYIVREGVRFTEAYQSKDLVKLFKDRIALTLSELREITRK